MNEMLIPPREPAPIRPPMVYVEKSVKWEYKQITCDVEQEQPLNETELKTLGEEGWEMSGIAQHPPKTYYYFKRQANK